MSEAVKSEHKTELAHRRATRCALAWAFTFTILSVAIYGVIRYEQFIEANVDWPILLGLNHYVVSDSFNHLIYRGSEAPILTGALLVGLCWYLWFEAGSDSVKAKLLLGLGAAVAAGILSRWLQIVLAVHLRPLRNPAPGFNMLLADLDPFRKEGWGSFPSDHASLYFALIAVIWRRSRWLGLFALLPALSGDLPRIYFGIHYPIDVGFGALLGIMLVILIEDYGPENLARRGVLLEHRRPGLFYFFGFLFSYEVAVLFWDVRKIGAGFIEAYRLIGL